MQNRKTKKPKKSKQSEQLKNKILEPKLVVLKMKGYDCKSYTLAAALKWLYDSKLIDQEPAPARTRDNPTHSGPSLRSHLKKSFHSAVGEVHNIEDLAAVAETQAQVAAYFCECKIEAQYTATIKKAIDQGLPSIVYYDVNNYSGTPTYGMPIERSGANDHAAVVMGYTYDQKNRLLFKVSQWGNEFDLDAKELFRSTSQLPKMRTIQKHYFKIKSHKEKEGGWLPEDFILKDYAKYSSRIIDRKLETNPTSNRGLGQKILILDSTINPRLDLGSMPVKLNRPTVFAGAASVAENKNEAMGRTFFWDAMIATNRACIAMEEKITQDCKPILPREIQAVAEIKQSNSCLLPEKQSTHDEWSKMLRTQPDLTQRFKLFASSPQANIEDEKLLVFSLRKK